MESRLLEILVCPLCKGSLHYKQQEQELVCNADKLAFPIRDGIPIMLESEARNLSESNQGGHPQGTTPASPGTSSTTSHAS